MPDIANNFTRLREVNAQLVRSRLKAVEAASKADLAAVTGLSVATCSNILAGMLAAGEVVERRFGLPAGGRPPRLYAYNPRFALTLLLFPKSVAGRKTLLHAVVDAKGRFLEREATRMRRLGMAELSARVRDVRSRHGNLKALAVSCPGLVRNGRVGISDLDEFRDEAVAAPLEAEFDMPALVENDTNCAAVGFHAAHPEFGGDVAYMVVPSRNAAGAGLVVNGRLHRGHSGFAGELSFMPLGVSRDSQFAGLDRRRTLEYVGKLAGIIIPFLNPSALVVAHESLDAAEAAKLREACRRHIPEEHMPVFELRASLDDDCLAGLAYLAADKLSGRVRLVEEDRI